MKTRGRPRQADSATYVYAVLHAARAPSLSSAPRGLPGGGPLRALDAGGGLWLVACDAPLGQYDGASLERGLRSLEWVALRAMGHQRVVEHCLGVGTVLPMKLFTLFRSDASALEHVRGRRRALRALARRVAGRREWGLRLSLDEKAAARSVRRGAARAGRGAGRGRAYLLRKTTERTLARDVLRDARQEAEAAYIALGRLAAAARRRAPAGESLVLDAAFLVPETAARRFAMAVARLQRRLAGRGIVAALTGPWPAYSFVGS